MKEVIETVMTPTTRSTWIAEDGTRFERKSDCEFYEHKTFVSDLDASPDIEQQLECNENNYPPLNGVFNEGNKFRWYKPLNENGIELLQKAYPELVEYYVEVGRWICIEIDNVDEDKWVHFLDDFFVYANMLLPMLGYDVSIKERKEC